MRKHLEYPEKMPRKRVESVTFFGFSWQKTRKSAENVTFSDEGRNILKAEKGENDTFFWENVTQNVTPTAEKLYINTIVFIYKTAKIGLKRQNVTFVTFFS